MFPLGSEARERKIFGDNLLVRVRWIIEMIVAERPCAMGVFPDFQVALYLRGRDVPLLDVNLATGFFLASRVRVLVSRSLAACGSTEGP